MKKITNKHGFSWLELLIVLSMLWFVLSISKPNFHYRNRGDSIKRACFSNQQILETALEIYNMDNTKMINTALPGGEFEDFHKNLITKKYLKNYLNLPDDNCSYGFLDITSSPFGSVFCKIHGSRLDKNGKSTLYNDKPSFPEYNTNLEKPFSLEHENIRHEIIQARKKKEYKDRIYKLFSGFILDPNPLIPLSTTIILIVIGVASSIKSSAKNKNV